jgi:DNA-binding MurR/RpiR family transcriptional regulator
MTESSTVRESILAVFDNLPPKQRQLARFFLDNEDSVAFVSANDIGERVGTSAATVVRFCRALGYEGYTDLQAAVRRKYPQYRTTVQKIVERMANGNFAENLSARVAQTNSQNIQDTMAQVSNAEISAAVAAIIQAKEIRIFGSGLSAAATVLAEHALTTLGFSARACLNGGMDQALEMSQLTRQDLVIVITIWRYFRDTVEAARAARTIGATCIALTDSLVSPVANLADYVFIATTEGAAHSRSLAGIVSLIDLLSAAVATQRIEASMKALQKVDNVYRQNNLLVSD